MIDLKDKSNERKLENIPHIDIIGASDAMVVVTGTTVSVWVDGVRLVRANATRLRFDMTASKHGVRE
jgi:hypothetical protein